MALNPADIAVVSQLLDQAIELPPGERDAWLEALPAQHQVHRDMLREMLTRAVALDEDSRFVRMPTLPVDESVAHAGVLVGPYRLIREIGRGGMGSVWLAERADGRFKRNVALKLPRMSWGAGLAERMAREREIGMLLEHPNIARLYDAGLDDRGRPYLALEFIEGEPLDAWCEANALGSRERLRLFVQVVRAVAYAHGRLVVHRDLKPSNILVSSNGQVHLLDFGVAKLLGALTPGDTGLTQQQGQALTPTYAAPEQIAGQLSTVACDIYSLGVLLYEVLTGSLPFSPKRKTLGAIEEAILMGDAPLASTRAKDRAAARALRGEVDAILVKAMQRDPERRYPTADAMALDIENHLHDRPVIARPDSLTYRARKRLRRHWIGASATAAAVGSLLFGVAALVQSQRAVESESREHLAKEFVVEVFKAVRRAETQNATPRLNSHQAHLEDDARLIQARFAAQPEIQAQLLGAVGSVFNEMGAFDLAEAYLKLKSEKLFAIGAPAEQQSAALIDLAEVVLSQGRPFDAMMPAERALTVIGGDSPEYSRALIVLARAQSDSGKHEEAEATLGRLEEDSAKAALALPRELAWAQAVRGDLLVRQGRTFEAIEIYRRAVDIVVAAEGGNSLTAAAIRLSAAWWFKELGDVPVANTLYQRSYDALRAAGGLHSIRAIRESARFAGLLRSVYSEDTEDKLKVSDLFFVPGHNVEASFRNIQRELGSYGDEAPTSLHAEVDFWRGVWLLEVGRVGEANQLIQLNAQSMLAGTEQSRERLAILGHIAAAMSISGRHSEAARLLEERRQVRIKYGLGEHPIAITDYILLAQNFLMMNKPTEANRLLESAASIEEVTRHSGLGTQALGLQLRSLRARVALEMGDPEGALRLIPTSETDYSATNTFGHDYTAAGTRGEVLCRLGKAREGLAILEAHLTSQKHFYSEHAPQMAMLKSKMGLCSLAAKKRARALVLAAQARRDFIDEPSVSPYFKAPLVKLEHDLGLILPSIP